MGEGVVIPQQLPDHPVSVARLARALGTSRQTLWRALKNDPSAPPPDTRDDLGHPLYRHGPVAAWWPKRRRRGGRRPAASAAG
jgi:hypothetical protein